LVHSVKAAISIGARVLGVVVPSPKLHSENIAKRECIGAAMAKLNYSMCIEDFYGAVTVKIGETHDEVGYHVAKMARSVAPIRLPKLYDKKIGVSDKIKPVGYEYVDESMMDERVFEREYDTIEGLIRCGLLPSSLTDVAMSKYGKVKFNMKQTSHTKMEWLHINYESKLGFAYPKIQLVNQACIADPETDWFKWYPVASNLNKHRANVNLRRYIQMCLESGVEFDRVCIELMNVHFGETQHFMVCILVYYMGVVMNMRKELKDAIIESGILYVGEDDWIDIHKQVHTLVRLTRTFNGVKLAWDEYVQLQYTQNIYGRKIYKPDAIEEIIKRQNRKLHTKKSYSDGIWSTSQYIKDFGYAIDDAYRRISEGIVEVEWDTMAEFIRRRYKIATKGSVTKTELPKDLRSGRQVMLYFDGVVRDIFTDPNKKSLLESEEVVKAVFESIFNNMGYNKSGVAPKYNEPAKKRVLIPGSLEHYIMMCYILANAEKGGQVGNTDLNMDQDDMNHFDSRLFDKGWKFMYDFPDHNSHHSAWEMQMVMYKLGNMFQRSNDMDFCIKWLMMSFDTMEIEGNRVYSGLYSGWRGTTWINTVLNHCYMLTAEMSYKRRYGVKPIESFEGRGDDVDCKVAIPEVAYKFYEVMKDMGYEDNEIKQLVTDEIHEFLRTVFTEDGIYTCLNRVLPGYVCGDLERGGADAEERIRANYVNIHMLGKRGLSDVMCKVLEKCNVARWGRVLDEDGYSEISKCVLHGRIEDGGLGIPDEYGTVWWLLEPVPRRVMDKISMRAKEYDLTREEVKEKLDELVAMGCRAKGNVDDGIREMAVSSHDFDSLTRSIIQHVGSSEFKAYWSHKTDVIGKLGVSTDIDEDLLRVWLMDADNPLVKKTNRVMSRYGALKSYLKFTYNNEEELADLICGQDYDILAAEKVKIDMRIAVRAPEWVVSSVQQYYRMLVFTREVELELAIAEAEVVVNTYIEKFKNIKM
jgi:hypothetical protein